MILLAQFHNKLINPDNDLLGQLWEKFYKNGDDNGWCKLNEFFELPMWMARIKSVTPDKELEIVVIDDISLFIERLKHSPLPISVMFSAMNANQKLIEYIINAVNGYDIKFCVGGYLDKLNVQNSLCWYFNSIEEYCRNYNLPFNDRCDYSIFYDYYGYKPKYIPRLTLSYGCRYNCKFCTIPNDVTIRSFEDILHDVDSITRYLDFEYIYLDDKTFGDADNYKLIIEFYDLIKSNRTKSDKCKPFKGFIVQTTAQFVHKIVRNEPDVDRCIAYYEIGMEIFADRMYKYYNKPTSQTTIERLYSPFMRLKLKNRVIYNIIVGLPKVVDSEYRDTISVLRYQSSIIHHINLYNFSVYEDATISQEIISDGGGDGLESKQIKSFHTNEDIELIENYYPKFLEYFDNKINQFK